MRGSHEKGGPGRGFGAPKARISQQIRPSHEPHQVKRRRARRIEFSITYWMDRKVAPPISLTPPVLPIPYPTRLLTALFTSILLPLASICIASLAQPFSRHPSLRPTLALSFPCLALISSCSYLLMIFTPG